MGSSTDLDRNGPLHAFWKCEYGHVLDVEGASKTSLGTAWSRDPQIALQGAKYRAKLLMGALIILRVPRSTGRAWKWSPWISTPEQGWPPAEVMAGFKAGTAETCVFDENDAVTEIFNAVEPFMPPGSGPG